MPDSGALMTKREFCARQGFSRGHLQNLDRIGRGPKYLQLGRIKRITPEAETEWRKMMAQRPVRGGLLALRDKAPKS